MLAKLSSKEPEKEKQNLHLALLKVKQNLGTVPWFWGSYFRQELQSLFQISPPNIGCFLIRDSMSTS